MYLLSKLTNTKFKIPILIVIIFIGYLLFSPFFHKTFIIFSKNIFLSESQYTSNLGDLQVENIKLSLEIERLKSLDYENKLLKRIIGFNREKKLSIIPSKVLSIEPSAFRKVLLLNGGEDLGIKEDMLVIDDRGNLIGKILRVYDTYCELTLIMDPNFTATVSMGEALGLMKGTLSGKVKVFYMEPSNSLKVGDLVTTRERSTGVELKAGKIKSITHDRNSLFLDITVEPFFRPEKFSTIFIVK